MAGAAVASTNAALDDDLILGHLAFYTIGESKVDEKTLESLFLKNGLPTRFIRKISKTDAFRRASSSAKASINILFNGTNAKAKIEVDEVKSDRTSIVRLVGRKVVDDTNEDLSYEVFGRVDFDRGNCSVSVSMDPNKLHMLAEYDYRNVLDEIAARYNDWAVYHTKDTIRNLTVSIVNELYPVNLMPSGVAKFIPKTQKGNLFALQGLIRDLGDHGSGNVFEIIPVIDTDEQRGLIDRTANSDMRNELVSMVKELKDIITTKQVVPLSTAKSYIQKFHTLQAKAQEYENLVGTYMTVIKSQIAKSLEYVENNLEEKV